MSNCNLKSFKHRSSFSLTLRAFTLIELLVVIGIIVVILGIGISIFNHTPARLIVNNIAAAIEKKMTLAQTQSSLQGIQKTLIFNKERNLLYFSNSKPDDDNSYEAATENPPDTPEPLKRSLIQTNTYLLLPSEVKVDFPDDDENSIIYNFYPDNSAAGPDMIISMKAHEILLSVSPLTGIVFTKVIDDD
jgi:prepilin-type N-terminal cleavage/methylation domain-containing protein